MEENNGLQSNFFQFPNAARIYCEQKTTTLLSSLTDTYFLPLCVCITETKDAVPWGLDSFSFLPH